MALASPHVAPVLMLMQWQPACAHVTDAPVLLLLLLLLGTRPAAVQPAAATPHSRSSRWAAPTQHPYATHTSAGGYTKKSI
jgi:hypothetical protein